MTEMEAVNSFNSELQSLYDVKPPISKGKMTAVTRAALKGVKLYKHVVQSVEKFIQKCKTEYKIPGLYVIDSIIRQSRHQFGAEKDVFAPRFARNLQTTFMHLYKCPDEDKAKVIRVLNLWQKNKIFTPELIQPLFDLADPNNPIWEQLLLQQEQSAKAAQNSGMNLGGPGSSGIPSVLSNLPTAPFKKEILDYDYGDDDEGGESRSQQNPSDGNYAQQTQNSHVGFDALGSILANPEILRQLATLQEQIAAATSQPSTGGYPTPEQERQRKMAELNKQEAAFDQRLAQTVARLPFAVDCDMPMGEDGKSPRRDGSVDQNSNQLGNHHGQPHQLLPPPFFQQINDQNQQGNHQAQQQQQHQQLLNFLGQQQQDGQNPFGLQLQFPVQGVQFPQHQELSHAMNMFNSQAAASDGLNQSFGGFNQNQGPVEIDLTDDSKDKDRRDRRRKRSRSRKSRSTSRSRIRKSRSRSRGRKRYRSRSRDRKEEKEREREKDKERVRKGFPTLKKEHLSVCSTTLWVGHLSKLVSQEELSDTFGAYGDIISIDLIAPRGCAFIVMNRRQDSLRALDRLRNTKLQGKTITLAWAPGKGMKGREWKDYWEVDSGVSYIPWQKLRLDINVEEFEDGGCIDEDTLPDFLKNRPKPPDQGAPPLPDSMEDSQDVPTPNANASSTPQISMSSMVGGDSVPKMGDTDTRSELSLSVQSNSNPIPGMPNSHPPFGIPPPVGMMPNMPMGMPNMPMGMVPPPMLGPGMGFPGMGLPGMPMMGNMGMMPPNMNIGGPPLGGPGLLGDMPATTLANLSHLNSMQHLNNSGMHLDKPPRNDRGPPEDEDKRRFSDRRDRDGKRRSRFDDPEDRNSVSMEDMEKNSPPQSQDQSKDDRPVFERLKSLADGYGFGNSEKGGPSLLGTPIGGQPPMGGMGPRGPGDRMPGPHGFPQPLLPHGGGPGNQFNPRGQFMGERPRVPGPGQGIGPPRQWFEPPNPFLNPNPFAGNPFIQGNMTENPFEIGGPPRNELDANLPGPGPGPAPLFGSPPERGGFGGGRGGRGGWTMDGPPGRGRGGGGRGGGNWREDSNEPENRDRDRERGMWGRGGRGGSRDSWNREDRDRDRDRDRGGDRGGRRDDRDRSKGSRERDSRDRRDRRDRSRDRDSNSFRDRRRRSTETEEDRRDSRSTERQNRDKPKEESLPMEEENWEEDEVVPAVVPESQSTQKEEGHRTDESNWDEKPSSSQGRVNNNNSTNPPGTEEENWDDETLQSQNKVNDSSNFQSEKGKWETIPGQDDDVKESQDSVNESDVVEKYGGVENWSENNVSNERQVENENEDCSQEEMNSKNYRAEEEEEQPIHQHDEEDSSNFHQNDNDDNDLSNHQSGLENSSNDQQHEEQDESSSNYLPNEENSSSNFHPQEEESVSNPHAFEEEREDETYQEDNHRNEAPSNNHIRQDEDFEDAPNYPVNNDSENSSTFQPPHHEEEEEEEFRNDKPHHQEDYTENNSQSWSNNGLNVHEHNNHNNSESTQYENDAEENFNDTVSDHHNNVHSAKNLIPPEEEIDNNCSEVNENNESIIHDEVNSNNIDTLETNEIGNGPS